MNMAANLLPAAALLLIFARGQHLSYQFCSNFLQIKCRVGLEFIRTNFDELPKVKNRGTNKPIVVMFTQQLEAIN